MSSNASAAQQISDCESALLQKTAEGIGLVSSFDPKKIDSETAKKAMDLYGSMLIDGLLECPDFRSRVEAAKLKEIERKKSRVEK